MLKVQNEGAQTMDEDRRSTNLSTDHMQENPLTASSLISSSGKKISAATDDMDDADPPDGTAGAKWLQKNVPDHPKTLKKP